MITYDDLNKLSIGVVLYSTDLKHANGTAMRCRVTGKPKVWVTRPGEFKVPVKYGLNSHFYISPVNAPLWTLTEPAKVEAKQNG